MPAIPELCKPRQEDARTSGRWGLQRDILFLKTKEKEKVEVGCSAVLLVTSGHSTQEAETDESQ